MKVTLDVATIANYGYEGRLGPALYWLDFAPAKPPAVDLGECYRTFWVGNDLAARADCGTFRALWRDGSRLLVQALDGWCPTVAHAVLP